MAANKARIPLAKMAAEETGMGIVEDKVIKNHYAAEYTYNAYTSLADMWCIWKRIRAYGIKKIAEPVGLVGASYPYNEPDIYSYLQDIDLFEDQKRNHHQPTSTC